LLVKILVTGGLGAVGTYLVPELRRRGQEVSVLDRVHAPGPSYYRADVGEYRQLKNVIDRVKPEMVYHLAAEFGRWNGEDFYETMWKSNAVGTKNLLTLAKEHGFRSVVFSSSEVYGDWDDQMDEDVMMKVPIRQMNDYAISKWVNELQVLNSASMHGTSTVRVRLFNTYGPGEHYSEYRSVICRFCYQALAGRPFTVHRGHRRTSTYITDCVNALATIAENFKAGEVYNISSSEYHDIETAAELVLRATGASSKLVKYTDGEAHTTKVKKVSPDKARRDLGMKTTVRLPEGIAETVKWMRNEYGFGK
jgi:dTDP-glucose 4,6-dehydratase